MFDYECYDKEIGYRNIGCAIAFYLYVLICKENALCLIVYVFCSVPQFLVKNFVWCRETEAFKTEDAAVGVCSHEEAFQVHWQTCTETKDLATDGEEFTLVLNRLIAEETFRRCADNSYFVAILAQ